MNKSKQVQVRAITIGLILTIIGIVVTVISTGVTLYTYANRPHNTTSTAQATSTFAANGQNFANFDASPSSGTLVVGFNQTAGNITANYDFKYKKTSQSSFILLKGVALSLNNPNGMYTLGSVDGRTDYNFRLEKKSGIATRTVVVTQWALH